MEAIETVHRYAFHRRVFDTHPDLLMEVGPTIPKSSPPQDQVLRTQYQNVTDRHVGEACDIQQPASRYFGEKYVAGFPFRNPKEQYPDETLFFNNSVGYFPLVIDPPPPGR
jgi:hypothetical protein